MDQNELVSIIVPIYNVASYLNKCLNSVVNQTYKNIEIILVNDGSTDESVEICKKWVLLDDRITLINKNNEGVSSARNAGLEVANGKYIYFLDSDDYISNTLIETVMYYFKNEVDLVIFPYVKVNEKGEVIRNNIFKSGEFVIEDKEDLCGFLTELLEYQYGWEPWNRIYKHSIIKKHDIKFEDNNRIFAEDLYFCFCYFVHVEKFVCIDNPLYYYVQRSHSIMQQNSYKLNIGRMNELSKAIYKYLSKQNECEFLTNIFSIYHYLIISPVINRGITKGLILYSNIRERIIQDVSDIKYFDNMLKQFSKHKRILAKKYSEAHIHEFCNTAKYYVDGNYLKFCLKNKLTYLFYN